MAPWSADCNLGVGIGRGVSIRMTTSKQAKEQRFVRGRPHSRTTSHLPPTFHGGYNFGMKQAELKALFWIEFALFGAGAFWIWIAQQTYGAAGRDASVVGAVFIGLGCMLLFSYFISWIMKFRK
jgi:hypothetical protein